MTGCNFIFSLGLFLFSILESIALSCIGACCTAICRVKTETNAGGRGGDTLARQDQPPKLPPEEQALQPADRLLTAAKWYPNTRRRKTRPGRNISKQLSISYGFGAEPTTAALTNNEIAINAAYTQLAAQGISVFVSTGDSGSQADGDGRTSVDISSSAPMVCAVGGTALTVQSPGVNENYLAESTWNYNNTASGGADGGGISRQWTVPSYQVSAATFASAVAGSSVSATNRNLPDISADASPETGIAIYVSQDPGLSGAGWYIFGGTSESAPLWAGFTALVNQNRTLAGLAPLGFPNNSLYPLAYTSIGLTKSYSSVFHDISDLSSNLTVPNGTNFAAVTGFDDSTGLGTMTGVPMITALSDGVLAK